MFLLIRTSLSMQFQSQVALNSIMFLLIHTRMLLHYHMFLSLNSIMFLLILFLSFINRFHGKL